MTDTFTPSVDLPIDLHPEMLDRAGRMGDVASLILHDRKPIKVEDDWGIRVDAYEVESFAFVYRTGLTEPRNDGYEDRIDDVMRCLIDPDLWFVKRQNYIDYYGGRFWSVHDNTPEAERPEEGMSWCGIKNSERYVIKTDDGFLRLSADALNIHITELAAGVLRRKNS